MSEVRAPEMSLVSFSYFQTSIFLYLTFKCNVLRLATEYHDLCLANANKIKQTMIFSIPSRTISSPIGF